MNQTSRSGRTAKPRALVRGIPDTAALTIMIRSAVGDFGGREISRVTIRRLEEGKLYGFMRIHRAGHESFLLDFEAALTPGGEISSLKVDDKRVDISGGKAKKSS